MKPESYSRIKQLNNIQEIFDLSGKVGVVTGGAGNMGQEFAKVLSGAGARIIIADQDIDKCKESVDEIESDTGSRPLIQQCDITNSEDIIKLFNVIEKEYGRLDFFIHNVMAKPKGYYESLENYSDDVWKNVIDVNLNSAYYITKNAEKLMEKSGGGSIVYTASIYGLVSPDPRIYEGSDPSKNIYDETIILNTPASYSASKGGLISLSKYMAILLAPKNIRVNVLVPGGVYDMQDEPFHDAYTQRTPLGRMAVWSDFNGAILFLVSDASRYMTGSNLVLDGGWTAW